MYSTVDISPGSGCPFCGDPIYSWWVTDRDTAMDTDPNNCTFPFSELEIHDAYKSPQYNEDQLVVIDHNGPEL